MDFVRILFIIKKYQTVDAIDNLKKLIISQYKQYIIYLKKGYKKDYTHIINKINYIDTCKFLNNKNFIYQKLINEL